MPGRVPPSAKDGVFALVDSIVIDAPVERVWEILLDTASYPQWNPFVRYQAAVDHQDKPLDDQTLAEGSQITIKANLPPSMEPRMLGGATRAVVSHLDHEEHRAAWKQQDNWKAWFLRFERWQWLTVVEDEEGMKTRYDNVEVFEGPVAYIVKWVVGPVLKTAVRAMAESLKRRAEESR